MPPRLIKDQAEALELLKQCLHVRWGDGFDPTKDRISCPANGRPNLLEVLEEGGAVAMFSGEQDAFVGISQVKQIPPDQIGEWGYQRWPIGIPVEIIAVFRSVPVSFGMLFAPEMRPYFGQQMHGRGISTVARLLASWARRPSA